MCCQTRSTHVQPLLALHNKSEEASARYYLAEDKPKWESNLAWMSLLPYCVGEDRRWHRRNNNGDSSVDLIIPGTGKSKIRLDCKHPKNAFVHLSWSRPRGLVRPRSICPNPRPNCRLLCGKQRQQFCKCAICQSRNLISKHMLVLITRSTISSSTKIWSRNSSRPSWPTSLACLWTTGKIIGMVPPSVARERTFKHFQRTVRLNRESHQ